ncbi:MAG: hypothetical protein ACP5XB_27795 [Isosphaeraceae bacterium]
MSPSTLLHDDPAVALDSETDEIEVQEEQDCALAEPRMVAPVVIPPLQPPVDLVESLSPQRKRVLDHLLGMADMYARTGALRQAVELYFELTKDHDGTDQAVLASDRLMAIAQKYEQNGEFRLARGIYQRLLNIS